MKALVTGGTGMLGRAVTEHFTERGYQVVSLGRAELDVTQEGEVRRAFELHRPSVVVHCAAYTAVDEAESCENVAFAVNATATEYVVRQCQRIGARFVYPSTDYVFSGEKRSPWRPDDIPCPVNAYGRSKLAGEQAALVWGETLLVRTSWLYGRGGPNFVERMIALASQREELQVVNDQVGRPTWTNFLAEAIADLIGAGANGVFHVAGGGEPASWFDFAREILERQGLATRVLPVPSGAYPRPAKRPLYSVLDCATTEKVIGRELESWRAMLGSYLQSRSLAGAER